MSANSARLKSSKSSSGPDYSNDESSREWKALSENLQAKDRYITTLEEALGLKDVHKASLERTVQ
jgi:hypothetical protein